MMMMHYRNYSLLLLVLLLVIARESESLQLQSNSRRNFFATAVKPVVAVAFAEASNAAIDVSGLTVESTSATGSGPGRGIEPSQIRSGPLSKTKLGFQVGGGARPEEVVRAIDAPRYEAVRKAQGLGPAFLEGVPREEPNDKPR